MEELKNGRLQNTRRKESYRREIIEIVQKIENTWILEVILRFIEGMIKEG